MLATKTRYTFADLLEQAPDDETVYDILGGELVVFSSPAEPHAAAVAELFGYLYAAQEAGHGQARTAPRAVAFDYGTRGTAAFLRVHGIDASVVYKVNEGRPSLADEIVNRRIAMVINTPLGRESFFDDKAVRRAAMMTGVPCITTITGAAAAVQAIRAMRSEGLDVRALQDYHAAVNAESA